MKFLVIWATSSRRIRALISFAFGIAAISLSGVANASYVTYTFSGPTSGLISGGSAPFNPTQPPFPPQFPLDLPEGFNTLSDNLGPISGYVTVNNEGVDRNSSPTIGSYTGAAVVPLFSMNFNGYTFAYDYRTSPPPPAAYTSVYVDNIDTENPPGGGLPRNFVQLTGVLGAGFFTDEVASKYRVQLSLTYTTHDLDVITSDALPTDLSAYSNWFLDMIISDSTTGAGAHYQSYVSLNPVGVSVPEPDSIVLFGLGLCGLALVTCRKKKGDPQFLRSVSH